MVGRQWEIMPIVPKIAQNLREVLQVELPLWWCNKVEAPIVEFIKTVHRRWEIRYCTTQDCVSPHGVIALLVLQGRRVWWRRGEGVFIYQWNPWAVAAFVAKWLWRNGGVTAHRAHTSQDNNRGLAWDEQFGPCEWCGLCCRNEHHRFPGFG